MRFSYVFAPFVGGADVECRILPCFLLLQNMIFRAATYGLYDMN